jgi:hypothetical protein
VSVTGSMPGRPSRFFGEQVNSLIAGAIPAQSVLKVTAVWYSDGRDDDKTRTISTTAFSLAVARLCSLEIWGDVV